jgi:hypothetical protein
MGEIVWTTDGQQLWVGDGLTQGGSPVVGANIAGFGLAYDPTTRRLEVAGLSADNIANGVNNKFFATELAQDAAASLFVTGTHSNISFVYDDSLGKINATVTLDGTGLTDVSADTTPQLGGDLDLNLNDITGAGNIDIVGNIENVGNINTESIISTSLTTGSILSNLIKPESGTEVTTEARTTTLKFSNSGAIPAVTDMAAMRIISSRGTIESPTTLLLDDLAGGFNVFGNLNSTDTLLSSFFTQITSNNGFGTNDKPTRLIWLALNTAGAYESLAFDSSGSLNSKAVQLRGMSQTDITNLPSLAYGASLASASGTIVYNTANNRLQMYVTNEWKNIQYDGTPVTTGSYNGSGSYPSGTAGMIIFDSSNNNFYGFDGSIWKQLNN